MIERIIDISKRGTRLCVDNHLLSIFHTDYEKTQTVPIGDIAALIFSTPSASLTQPVISELSKAGAIIVFCDSQHQPASMTLPLQNNVVQSERFRIQAETSLPVKKSAWQQIVRCKVNRQGEVLEQICGGDGGLKRLSTKVKSGDSENIEAQAARIYWKSLGLFPKREPGKDSVNSLFDFGYTVLLSLVARSICAAGLHPCLGLHHRNRYNPFCLATDLMEPFRPIVDISVINLCRASKIEEGLTKAIKGKLLAPLVEIRVLSSGNKWQKLASSLNSLCGSLIRVFNGEKKERLFLPLGFKKEEFPDGS